MAALWLWWTLLPVFVRRLVGAVLLLAALAGGLLLWHHRAFTSGYDAGHKAGADSAWLADKRKQQVALDSMEHRSDSLVTIRHHEDSLLTAETQSVTKAIAARPTGLRLETLPDSFRTVPSLDMVRVTVESTNEVFDVPRGAAVYWKAADSLVSVASQLIVKYVAANKQWSEAWTAEHDARIGADSLAAQWRVRALAVQPAQHSGHTRQVVTVVLSLVTGYFVARHIR